jgi:hypothetical protein
VADGGAREHRQDADRSSVRQERIPGVGHPRARGPLQSLEVWIAHHIVGDVRRGRSMMRASAGLATGMWDLKPPGVTLASELACNTRVRPPFATSQIRTAAASR